MKVIFHKHFDCVRKIYYRKPVKASSEETWEINAPKFKPILLADPPEVHLLLSAANRHSNNKQRGVAAGLAERIFSATCFASERVARNLCKAAQLPNLWRIRICARHTCTYTLAACSSSAARRVNMRAHIHKSWLRRVCARALFNVCTYITMSTLRRVVCEPRCGSTRN